MKDRIFDAGEEAFLKAAPPGQEEDQGQEDADYNDDDAWNDRYDDEDDS